MGVDDPDDAITRAARRWGGQAGAIDEHGEERRSTAKDLPPSWRSLPALVVRAPDGSPTRWVPWNSKVHGRSVSIRAMTPEELAEWRAERAATGEPYQNTASVVVIEK